MKQPQDPLSEGQIHFKANMNARKQVGRLWSVIFLLATMIGVFSLVVLIGSIVDQSFGYVVVEYENSPQSLIGEGGKSFGDLSAPELIGVIQKAKEDGIVTGGRLRNIQAEKGKFDQWTVDDLRAFVLKDLAIPSIKQTWTLAESVFSGSAIAGKAKESYPNGELTFRFWLNASFLTGSQSDQAMDSGLRSAIIGSLWVILIAVLFAFPIGIGAAIYLEEYAQNNWLNKIIQTNIYNLAGVPSIIYGMLGLAIFVRFLEPLTSGSIFGVVGAGETSNGRTILAAGLTLALLILPIIIINAQEALKAIPSSLRYSSFGVGATKWQTIWHHVLPASLDRILTGTVFAVSRGLGETAPLVVVGASTFLTLDPSGPFSKFTSLPIQIYNWSSMPQQEFRHLAGAAIIVLMILLMGINAFAIYFRNKIRKQKDAQ